MELRLALANARSFAKLDRVVQTILFESKSAPLFVGLYPEGKAGTS